jgi:hypothetical protein
MAHHRIAIRYSPDYSNTAIETYVNFIDAALNRAFPFDLLGFALAQLAVLVTGIL